MRSYVVAKPGDIPPGNRKLVTLRGQEITIFNVKGDYLAILNRCPHQGGSLCKGKLAGLIQSDGPGSYRYHRKSEVIRCPWYGWEFDLRTVKSYCDPSRTWVTGFTTTIQPGSQVVEGPYVAETFQVIVDDDYVVIEM